MVFKLNKSISSSYSHLAIIFFVMTTILTVVRGVFHDIFRDDYLRYLAPLFAPVGVLFFVFMVRLIRNLGVNERFVKFILGLLAAAIILRLITVLIVRDVQLAFIFSSLSSSMLLIMQSICVYFMCNNLFIEVNPIKEKLWASVCVYFMIGATFGTVYSLLLTISPVALGTELSKPVDIYIMGLVYSFNVISGVDPIYDNASETIRMTAVLESIFTMLFMVILIGRLLGSKTEE
jgi:hypothetical protein